MNDLKKMTITFLSALMFVLPNAVFAEGGEHIVWDKTPIAFDLRIGQERILHFQEPIEVDAMQSNLTANQVRLINNQGSLYLLAHEALQTQRLLVHLLKSRQVVLIDIQTREQADTYPITVLLPQEKKSPASTPSAHEPLSDYVKLTRHALKQLYAPKRLIQDLPGFRPVPIKLNKPLPLLRHHSVASKVLMSWRYGTYSVTAVKITNQSDLGFSFSPQLLRGDWLSASSYPHSQFAPQGDPNDTRVVVLIAHQSFEQVLAPWS